MDKTWSFQTLSSLFTEQVGECPSFFMFKDQGFMVRTCVNVKKNNSVGDKFCITRISEETLHVLVEILLKVDSRKSPYDLLKSG